MDHLGFSLFSKVLKLTAFFICFNGSTVVFAQSVFNIESFGAKADGKTLNTTAIQAAIDSAHHLGGGKVIVPKGTFLSGSIVLKSNVHLELKKKAILLGSKMPEDYIFLNRWTALIMADQAENIKISGKGIIDGQGKSLALHIDSLFYEGEIDSADYIFPEKRPSVTIRPQLIEFVACKKVSVSGITLKNAASWVQSYYMCENLIVDDIHVDSDTYWNNDGIDIIDCKKVSITNSFFNASDDGICIKSYGRKKHGRPFCEEIYIANCKVRSSASAVKFGTASFGGFRDIVIEKIKVFDTFRSAIALESYGNGFLENVKIDRVTAKNTGNALFIRIGQRSNRLSPGKLKNVSITNLKAHIPFSAADLDYEIRGPALPFFHNTFPASITGLPNQKVQDIRLENIQISYPGRGNKAFAYSPLSRIEEVPENPEIYPEFSMFGELPAWGFYVRHVENLSMKNIKIKVRKPDYRPAFVFDDVMKLNLESITVKGDKKVSPYFFNNSSEIEIKSD